MWWTFNILKLLSLPSTMASTWTTASFLAWACHPYAYPSKNYKHELRENASLTLSCPCINTSMPFYCLQDKTTSIRASYSKTSMTSLFWTSLASFLDHPHLTFYVPRKLKRSCFFSASAFTPFDYNMFFASLCLFLLPWIPFLSLSFE